MRLMEPEDYSLPPITAPSSPKFTRRFKDCIHDYMPFNRKICHIIDTPQFQRLRNIKQLGTSYHVWPTASHNRFEHSLGVAYLSMILAQHLQQSQPELRITQRDIDCVTIAGLCHDLGHGPWSHVWDGQFIRRALPGATWQHEHASDMMFDALIQGCQMEADKKDVTFIKALIGGDKSMCPLEKQFLFDIVANKRNGLDVDKFDYIARDNHAVDVKGNLSLTRLIHSSRVINDEICYDIKDANQVYELCWTRFSLHKRIYNHKTAKAIEYMLVDALLLADRHLNFSRHIYDPAKFLYLTDHLRTQIESSEEPELAEARAIFFRITTRNLYRMVDYKVFEWSYIDHCRRYFTPERIVDAVKRLPATLLASREVEDLDTEEGEGEGKSEGVGEPIDGDIAALEPRHVIVDLSRMHYGMKDKNPLDSVKFYSKQHPNRSRKAELGDISLLMPQTFGEVLLRVYTRDPRFYGLIQAGYRELLAHSNEEFEEAREDADVLPLSLSPPITEAPSTPRPAQRSMSRVASGARLFGGEEPGTGTSGKTWSNNAFTSVPTNYKLPQSPSAERAQIAARRSSKRKERDGSPPVPTRKSTRRA
ncbi:HD-domain/PDEase-like protein [Sparassis crispa]|uniref:HD-domain/PDEase-like protein n=1 Tax=Sparassis crispa TaxID=139825 RepID=A0A401GA48_9APHY|nr:HD-domain/PDEase-like protein [Sparassis crispa]GBE79040.1 HD-domain/PDEase-like protein [Sparassis crispa]